MSSQGPPAETGSWPDPLICADGTDVVSAEDWREVRRAELLGAFEDSVYGPWPPPPQEMTVRASSEAELWDGAARLRELELRTVRPDSTFRVLVVSPSHAEQAPVPAFLTANFFGNHRLLDHPAIAISTASPGRDETAPGQRGSDAADWDVRATVAAGYAVVSFAKDEVVPDDPALAAGPLQGFARDGRPTAALSAWAWGFSQTLDALAEVSEIDHRRVVAVGHSRLGKAALWAAAVDERFAAVIPSQAGSGGTSPSRTDPTLAAPGADGRPTAETVGEITRRFPHWFADRYAHHADRVQELAVEQHELVALCAPRPVLLSNASEDDWADPVGQFEVLRGADPVYRLVAGSGLESVRRPAVGESTLGRLGYALRPGGHSMDAGDWRTWRAFADRWV